MKGEARRVYNRLWIRHRREEFFDGKSCALCGSEESLEIDHVDPKTKVSHHIWSWSKARQLVELAKCRVLCRACHQRRHALERPKHGRGGWDKGCRCVECVSAQNKHQLLWRNKRRELRALAKVA